MNNRMNNRRVESLLGGGTGQRVGELGMSPLESPCSGGLDLESGQTVGGMDGQQDVRICVWGPDLVSEDTFWKRVEYICNYGNILYSIRSVLRVRQPNRVVRYDVWVIPQDAKRLLRKLQGRGRSFWGWTARLYQSYNSRHGGRMDRVERVPSVHNMGGERRDGAATLVSLNVNGIRDKKPDVQRLLERSRATVMALQETLLRPEDWVLRIPGYHCFSACGTHGASDRGVALLLRRGVSGYVVGKPTPCFIAARVFGGTIRSPMVVASFYAPAGKDGVVRIRYAQRQLQQIAEQYPDDAIMVMGDWNRQRAHVLRRLLRWTVPMTLVAPRGTVRRTSRRSNRVIDHIATRRVVDVAYGPVRTLRKWDISDHYPISLKVHFKGRDEQSTVVSTPHDADPKRLALGRILYPSEHAKEQASELRKSICTSNRWQVLADWEDAENGDPPPVVALTSEALNTAACGWVETVNTVCEEAGLRQQVGKSRSLALPKHVSALIDKRCKIFAKLKRVRRSSPEYGRLKREYDRLRGAAKAAFKSHRSKQWRRSLGSASRCMSYEPRRFWKWASSMAGWRRKDEHVGAQPVRDPRTGRLVTDAEGISEAWGLHYQQLAKDVTGNSRNPALGCWEGRLASHPRYEGMDELEADISAEELVGAIQILKNNKAPGRDGIPAEALKLAVTEDGVLSPMGRSVWWLVTQMWAGSMVPEVWADSVVVSIPKKGDLTIMGNYRGISLMGTVLKVLMRIVADRLERAFESRGRFSPGQAGFRQREECPTQIACLLEICKRRALRDHTTYLMFVDLEKAYDTVPHAGLFHKLEQHGVRGRMLSFLRAVYSCSRVCVRSGDAPFQFSRSFPLERGLRQGCPASPILFNIFINDVLDGMKHGAKVEVAVERWIRVPGLLYADDLVLLANSRRGLQQLADDLTTWMGRNEMRPGIKKCAVMHVPRFGGIPGRHRPFRWTLSGQAVDEVQEYTYLGINFRADWDIPKMVADRCEKGKRLFGALQPFLYSRTIPIHMKMAVTRAVLVPVLLYGAEIYGMNKSITGKMQSFLTGALKAVVGLSQSSRTGLVSLWRELKMPPICALAAGRRARALVKCRSLRTWVSRLAGMEFRARRKTWMTLTRQWCRTYIPRLVQRCLIDGDDVPLYLIQTDGWLTQEPKTLSKDITTLVWGREERLRLSGNARWYFGAGFHTRRICIPRSGVVPGFLRGINLVLKCRLGAYWTAYMLARRGLAPACMLHFCPYCRQMQPETLEHMFLRCPRWQTQRGVWLSYWIIRSNRLLHSRDPNLDPQRVILLLGGRVARRRLSCWQYKQPDEIIGGGSGDSTDSDDDDSGFGVVDSTTVTDLTHGCGLLAVAGFLSSIAGDRGGLAERIAAMR